MIKRRKHKQNKNSLKFSKVKKIVLSHKKLTTSESTAENYIKLLQIRLNS